MFNPFKRKKKSLERLSDIASVFNSINKLMKSNLLYWDRRHKRLFIADPVASLFLAQGNEAWSAFLNNVYQYVVYIHQQGEWNRLITRRKQKAVAQAKRENPALTKMDIDRIERAVDAELKEDDVPLTPIEPFEFYVVADTRDSKAQTTLVGNYNPDTQTFEMVSWQELQSKIASIPSEE